MAALTDTFDLAKLNLSSGEGRRLTLAVALEPFEFAGTEYAVDPARIDVTLDISRMTHDGYALRLRFSAALVGPCMRCLEPASPSIDVDAREVDQVGGGEELSSPYVVAGVLDLAQWARDAYALTLPNQVVCRRGLRRACARSAARASTTIPATRTRARRTRAGPSCASCASSELSRGRPARGCRTRRRRRP